MEIKMNTKKKELQRIDWNVSKRILIKLHITGRITKTDLATKCNIGYDKLVLYLDWLEIMDMIDRKIEPDTRLECIKLSETGIHFCNAKLSTNSFR
jgi:predicted transcriptional regulator